MCSTRNVQTKTKERTERGLTGLVLGGVLLAAGAVAGMARAPKPPPPAPSDAAAVPQAATQMVVRVTGYCNCGTCCGWRRSWFGFGPPVFAQGPLKGRRKQVGVTARGTRARTGTVAADPSFFPFGTRLVVPGYGEGIVEDVGGSIQGRHIDVWFPSHEEARKWGTRDLTVDVRLDAKLENSSSSR